MIRIRLKRMGAKARPFYRIVVMPETMQRDGRAVDEIGTYDPLKEPYEVNLNKEKALDWLRNGASASDTVVQILKREGIWEEFENGKAKKAKKKPKKPRVKKVKPVKEKKRKSKPQEESAEVSAETKTEETVAESSDVTEPETASEEPTETEE